MSPLDAKINGVNSSNYDIYSQLDSNTALLSITTGTGDDGRMPYVEIRDKAQDNLLLLQNTSLYNNCEDIQTEWFAVINDAVCTGLFEGVRDIWMGQLVSTLFLFIIIIVASILSRHYYVEGIGPDFLRQFEALEEEKGRH
mgnify:CR=1 FL=1